MGYNNYYEILVHITRRQMHGDINKHSFKNFSGTEQSVEY